MNNKYKNLSGEAGLFRVLPDNGGIESVRQETQTSALSKELQEICHADTGILSAALKKMPESEINNLEVLARRLLMFVEKRKNT